MSIFLKKIKKEEVITYFILLIIAIFVCHNFVYFHKVTDTYNVLESGYEEYSNKFLKDGRMISFLIFRTGNLLQIPMEVFITVIGVLAIIIQTISVFLIYNFLKNNYILLEGKRKYFLLAGCFLVIFNPFAIEHLAYAESAIITLGTLFSIIASIQLTKDKTKNILISIFLTILSVISYQGTINIFITLSILFLILEPQITKKQIVKRITIIIICTVIALISCYLAINIGSTIFGSERIEKRLLLNTEFINERIVLLIQTLKNSILKVITRCFSLLPQNTILISIIFTYTYILFHESFKIECKNEKRNINFAQGWIKILKYTIVILVAILSSILPMYLTKEPSIAARTSSSIGAILGLNIIYILSLQVKSKKIEFFIPIIITTTVLLNIYQYKTIGNITHITNSLDKYVTLQINDIIKEYEEKNKTTVENIAIYCDKNITRTYLDMSVNTYTDRALSAFYSVKDCLQYYTNREFKEVTIDIEIYEKHFKNKDWNTFQSEQIVIEGDTIHFCIY